MADVQEDEEVVRTDLCLEVERALVESSEQRLDAAFEAAASLEDASLKTALELARSLCQGQYAHVLRSEAGSRVLRVLQGAATKRDDESVEAAHVATRISASLDAMVVETETPALRRAVVIEIFCVGIAALNLFVQANYTGPAIDVTTIQDLLTSVAGILLPESETYDPASAQLKLAALVWLQVDGESPFTICEFPSLLVLGRAILTFVGNWTHSNWSVPVEQVDPRKPNDDVAGISSITKESRDMLKELKTAAWWNARAAVVHARLILTSEPPVTLWYEARRGFLRTLATKDMFDTGLHPEYLHARALVEWGLAQHVFDKSKRGKHTFADALETSGLMVQLSGALGKRTKFQQKSHAQMVLLATSKHAPAQNTVSMYADAMANTTHVDFGGRQEDEESTAAAQTEQVDEASLDEEDQEALRIQQMVQDGDATYREVQLDQVDADNYLLERTAFEDKTMTEQGNLQIIDQVVLLALCLDVKNSNPNDGLTREQIFPYVTRVLENPNNWMVYSTALLERAWLECEMHKRRERGVLQMQALVDQHTARLTVLQNSRAAIEDAAPAEERMAFVYSLAFPPRYALKRDLAERYYALGVVRSALELFLELEMWDDVVKCYQIIDQPTKAEKVVRERLEVAPSPYMWTALGDITGELSHYETAWELSHHRYARAKRSLGRAYFEKHDYQAAIPHYEDSVHISPMNCSSWFVLGTMAMRIEDWKLALRAFTRVVQLEPDNGEAWGNIGSIHLREERFAEAFSVLQEALKQKRHMWQMWENFAFCALQIEKYGEAMYAMHQWLDLRAKHKRPVDHELLAWLVEAIVFPEALEEATTKGDQEGSNVEENVAAPLDTVTTDEEDDDDLGDLDETAAVPDRAPPLSNGHYKKQLALLLGRMTSIVTNNPKLWQVYAHFNDGVQRPEKALDCRLKQCRALQSANWETDEKSVEELCVAAQRLAEDYKADGSKKALTACRLYLRGIVKKAQLDFAHLDACQSLAATLEEVEALEQAAAQA